MWILRVIGAVVAFLVVLWLVLRLTETPPPEPPLVPAAPNGLLENQAEEAADQTREAAWTGDVSSAAAETTEDALPPADVLWQVVDEGTVDELPSYKEVVPGRALVRMANLSPAWDVGDRIAVEIPQIGALYRPVIEEIKAGPGGRRSFVGVLAEEAGRRYGFVITVGPGSAFAYLSTPWGSYELVAQGELGWLMPTANMDQHVDYSKPDYLIVEDRNGGR